MKNKRCKLAIIIIVIALMLTSCSKTQTADSEECENCTIEQEGDVENEINIDNPFNLTFSGKTIKYNAYDFIIEKMSQAQYWTYDEYNPFYSLCNHFYENTHADPTGEDKNEPYIVNGTGWILYDEDTASFARGWSSKLVINFSDNNAKSYGDSFYLSDYDNTSHTLFDESQGGEDTYEYFDFVNPDWVYYFQGEGSDVEYNVPPEYEYVLDKWWEINRTMTFYDDLFSILGINIRNMPAGTLASYKNKTIEVPIELVELKYYDRFGDDKIHSPYDERVGWSWYWEDNQGDNVWLDDYHDILNQQLPESTENETMEVIDSETGKVSIEYTYAPIFLCLTNTKWSHGYDNNAQGWDINGEFYNFAGALETYWLKPLYKQIFGFNGVYFYDESKIPNDDVNSISYTTLDNFNNNLTVSANEIGDIVTIYNKGDVPIGSDEQITFMFYGVDNMVTEMKSLCKHYNVDSMFGDDFVDNLALMYDYATQCALGLR